MEGLEFQAKDLGPPQGQGSPGSLGVEGGQGCLDHICVLERSLWFGGLEGRGGETREKATAIVQVREGTVTEGWIWGTERRDLKSYLGK